MASDTPDRLTGWSFLGALAVAALATAVVSTALEGTVKWVGVAAAVLVWVAFVAAVRWRRA